MQLLPDQVYASLNGITFGAVDAQGVDWSLVSLTGWAATAPTLAFTQKPRQSGAWAGDSFSGPRTLALGGRIYAPSAQALRDAIDRLNAAVTLGPSTLTVTEAGVTRSVVVRQSDDVIVSWVMPTIAEWSIQVASADWRKFGTTISGTVSLPSSSGGLTIGGTPGLKVPFSINAVTNTGQLSLNNPGNTAGTVRFRVDGPCNGPVITHTANGKTTTFATSLVLNAGEYLLIDPESRTMLANGQASRSAYITSRGWPSFQPGNNVYSFTANTYNSQSLLTVEAVPAWR
jgi:hypothetical protein